MLNNQGSINGIWTEIQYDIFVYMIQIWPFPSRGQAIHQALETNLIDCILIKALFADEFSVPEKIIQQVYLRYVHYGD